MRTEEYCLGGNVSRSPTASIGQLREALDRLEGLVMDGVKHGFFDFSIACEIANGCKRKLVIRAGKSYQFTIPEDEVPR